MFARCVGWGASWGESKWLRMTVFFLLSHKTLAWFLQLYKQKIVGTGFSKWKHCKRSRKLLHCKLQRDSSCMLHWPFKSPSTIGVYAVIMIWAWHNNKWPTFHNTQTHEKRLTHIMQTDRQTSIYFPPIWPWSKNHAAQIILTGWVQSWNSEGGKKHVCAEDKKRSKEKAQRDRGKGILALGTVESRLLGHVDGRSQKWPVRSCRHHAGCEAQRTVQHFSLRIKKLFHSITMFGLDNLLLAVFI